MWEERGRKGYNEQEVSGLRYRHPLWTPYVHHSLPLFSLLLTKGGMFGLGCICKAKGQQEKVTATYEIHIYIIYTIIIISAT